MYKSKRMIIYELLQKMISSAAVSTGKIENYKVFKSNLAIEHHCSAEFIDKIIQLFENADKLIIDMDNDCLIVYKTMEDESAILEKEIKAILTQ